MKIEATAASATRSAIPDLICPESGQTAVRDARRGARNFLNRGSGPRRPTERIVSAAGGFGKTSGNAVRRVESEMFGEGNRD